MNYPTGKGAFIWQLKNCAGGDAARLAVMAVDAGFSWVAIKAADGYADFNPDRLMGATAALRARNIKVWGWHYIYGGLAKAEADAALRNISKYQFEGWIMDGESEYKRSGAAGWASTYCSYLRASYPDLPLGLCSFRYPFYHTEFPWSTFLHFADFHMPQVYWVDANNPTYQLNRSYKALIGLKDLPFVPLGAAYSENGWAPTVGEINEFDKAVHDLKLPGIGWWCWDDHGLEEHPEWWAAVKAHKWEAPLPPQDWHWAADKFLRTLGYKGPDPDGHLN